VRLAAAFATWPKWSTDENVAETLKVYRRHRRYSRP
jgi:hypothetical protein